jgi:hypothetical protein
VESATLNGLLHHDKEKDMKRNVLWSAVVIGLGAVVTSGVSIAAQGGGGGGKPAVESSNNLSYPAVLTGAGPALPGLPGEWTLNGVFPTNMSFGCAMPELIGTAEYPNTSCVTGTGVPLSYDDCRAICGAVPVERIYWQKDSANVWQAQNFLLTPQSAEFVDWGDNLESVTWTTSSNIRVETTPFAVTEFAQTGFQMWHVFGQGPSELWGVRATDPADLATPGDPYGYTTNYAIIRSPNARIGLTKLNDLAETCASPSPYATKFAWDPVARLWTGATLVLDDEYTPELNIGGKFVYGYNWSMKKFVVPAGVEKAGWWRLTFHAPDVLFTPTTVTTPPVLPDSAPMTPNISLISRITITADEGPLYTPVVDPVNHITYIDICLAEGRGSSGKPR